MRRFALLCVALPIGCVLHRGPNWTPVEPSTSRDPSVLVLGNAGAEGRGSKVVAEQVERLLTADATPPVVIWIGDPITGGRVTGRCAQTADHGTQELVRTVDRHVRKGAASYAVGGFSSWRCGDPIDLASDATRTNPWTRPAFHYVVRIDADGRSRIVSACDEGSCHLLEAAAESARVDLVLVDLAPWYLPALERRAPTALEERVMAELDALLGAVRASRSGAPPRVLVSEVPIEAGGYFGVGGAVPVATFHELPPSLQEAVLAGSFVGVLGALDPAIYAVQDIGPALKRSDKRWLPHPMFQIVAGSSGAGPRALQRMRYFNAISHIPEWFSPNPGFASLRLGADHIDAELFARRAGRWSSAELRVSTRPQPFPLDTPTPPTAPCRQCPEIPHTERD